MPPDTAAALEALPCAGPFAVIATVGRYRTGKSLLANRGILQLPRGHGFGVGTTVQACTKGIWVYPQLVDVGGCRCLVLDTEGTASLDASADDDARLVTLALLLSSLLVFNSVGCLDETNLSNLGTVSLLARDIYAGTPPSVALVWCLRDFTLQLRGSDGEETTPDRYLEETLASETRTRLRECLDDTFTSRHLFPFVRPCSGEMELQNANSLGDGVLRIEFRQQMVRFRTLLGATAKPKQVGEEPISPSVFVALTRRLSESLSNRQLPTVRDTFGFVIQAAKDRHLGNVDAALAAFLAEQDLPRDPARLRAVFDAATPPTPSMLRGEDRDLEDAVALVVCKAWDVLEARNEEASRKWTSKHVRDFVDPREYLREASLRVGLPRACETVGLVHDAAVERATSLAAERAAAARSEIGQLEEALCSANLRLESTLAGETERVSLRESLEALQRELCEQGSAAVTREQSLLEELAEARTEAVQREDHYPDANAEEELLRLRQALAQSEAQCEALVGAQREGTANADHAICGLRAEVSQALSSVTLEHQRRVDALREQEGELREQLAAALLAADSAREEAEAARKTAEAEVREERSKFSVLLCERTNTLRLAHDEAVADTRAERSIAATAERNVVRFETECSILKRKAEQKTELSMEVKRCKARLKKSDEDLVRRDTQLEALRDALQESHRQATAAQAQNQATLRAHMFEVASLQIRLKAAQACFDATNPTG